MNNESKKSYFTGKLIIGIFVLLFIVSLGYLIHALIAKSLSANLGLTILCLAVAMISAITLLIMVSIYNKFIRIKHKVEESLALIDIQLKLRFDLIPNLVATVKGYATHEKSVFTEISRLRKLANKSTDEQTRIEIANKIVPKMRQIIAIAENYPELKSDAMFKSLMDELVLVEDKIVAARRFYDSNVNLFNTAIAVWPSSVIAKSFGFSKLQLYKIDAGEKINIRINLNEG